jgi:hypothetical protein
MLALGSTHFNVWKEPGHTRAKAAIVNRADVIVCVGGQ